MGGIDLPFIKSIQDMSKVYEIRSWERTVLRRRRALRDRQATALRYSAPSVIMASERRSNIRKILTRSRRMASIEETQ
jgi:hypothetical protein